MRVQVIRFWQRYLGAFKAGAVVGLAASLIILLVLGAKNLQQSQANGVQIKRQIAQLQVAIHQLKQNAADRSAQIATINQHINQLNDHMDCIVELFSRPNHQQLTIDDIHNCKLTTTKPTTQPSPTVTKSANTTSQPGSGAHPKHTPAHPNSIWNRIEKFLGIGG